MRRSMTYLLAAAAALSLAAAVLVAVLILRGNDEPTSPLAGATATERPVRTRIPLESTSSVIDPAAQSVLRQYGYIADGKWAEHWQELHPEQRRDVPQAAYVQCQSMSPLRVDSVRAIRVRSDPVSVGGVQKEATEVTIQLTGGFRPAVPVETITRMVHQVLVDGQWYWVMTEDAVAAFRRGACP